MQVKSLGLSLVAESVDQDDLVRGNSVAIGHSQINLTGLLGMPVTTE